MIPVSRDGSPLGTPADMAARLRATLPGGWFAVPPPPPAASTTPVLDALLLGLGAAWSYCFGLLSSVVAQARVRTASGPFLDMMAVDFFASGLQRLAGETDVKFRDRILASLLSRKATRPDVAQAVAIVTSAPPAICEFVNGADCGGYTTAGSLTIGGMPGYGSPGLRYGSGSFPFQYILIAPGLVTFAPGIICSRQTSATYLDASGLIRRAAPRTLRPDYQQGVCVGPLLEGRGFNMIRDSRGWAGFAQSPGPGTDGATWTIGAFGTALFGGDPVVTVFGIAGTDVAGPSVDVAAGGAQLAGSVWIRIEAGCTLTAVQLVMTDLNHAGSSVMAGADLSRTGQWQRLWTSIETMGAPGVNLRVGLLLSCSDAAAATLATQCWQVEPGTVTTSYIPTNGTLGIRAQDDVRQADASAPVRVAEGAEVMRAVAATIPAATIAWTSVPPSYAPG